MKSLIQILPFILISPLLVANGAAGATTPAPKGYIVTFGLADCVDEGGLNGQETATTTSLPLNECQNINIFTSFEAGIDVPCPSGKVATVQAYLENNCAGNAVSGGVLPADGNRGTCTETLLSLTSGPSLGGHSAKFTCA